MIGSGKRTIYVDDNNLSRNLISKKLEDLGFIVDRAESANELFELMKINEYDILCLDDMMPIMSGTEAMQKLKSEGYLKPIIVITGNESPADRDKYLSVGFDKYVAKGDLTSLGTVIGELF